MDDEINNQQDEWTLIYESHDLMEAGRLNDNLESAGIPVQSFSKIDSTGLFSLTDNGKIKLFVPNDLADDAKDIISEIKSHPDLSIETEE